MNTPSSLRTTQEIRLDQGTSQKFQRLKSDIHRRIVEMLDISKLEKVRPERLRQDVRTLAQKLTKETTDNLSGAEQERMVDEVLHEVFGLGPLEIFVNDPEISDILVNGPAQVYVERKRPHRRNQRGVRRQRTPDSGHSTYRRTGGPPHRRNVADGGRPTAGWFARQRHNPAACDGWPGAVDSPLRRAVAG